MSIWLIAAVASAQSLVVSGSCPGVVELTVEDVTEGGEVLFVGGPDGGQAALVDGECAGTVTGLGRSARQIGPLPVVAPGIVAASPRIGNRQANWLVQAVDLSTCTVTEPVAICGDGGSELELTADHENVDLSVVLDTTCSMSAWLDGLRDRFPSAAVSLGADLDSLTFGFATYDDYNDASFGSGLDKPFELRQQQTTDAGRLSAALDAAAIHSGADGPESGNEAIYQAFTGAGYDQDCDGRYDSADDVYPLISSPLDAFGGRTPDSYDPTTPSGGELGGMGFREGALPIVVLITDNELRDPADGYDSPGGCSIDASAGDAIAAARGLGGRIVGVNVSAFNDTGRRQLADLAIATDSRVDVDGDGSIEPAVYELGDPAEITATLLSAVTGLTAPASFDSIRLEVVEDPTESVRAVAPEAYVDMPGGSDLTFTVAGLGPIVEGPTDYPVRIALKSGRYTLSEQIIYIDR